MYMCVYVCVSRANPDLGDGGVRRAHLGTCSQWNGGGLCMLHRGPRSCLALAFKSLKVYIALMLH